MKKLVLGALMTASLLQAGTGCIISGDDDDDDVVVDDGDDISDDTSDDTTDDSSDDGGAGISYFVTWLCPPDATEIEFTATPVGSATSLTPDVFACEDGDEGKEILYDAGDYDIDIIPLGDIGTFAGLTDTVSGDDGTDITADYADFPEDAGYFFLTWTVDGDDPAVVCPEIGADGVSVLATLVGTDIGTDDIFECEAGEGITSELLIGDYEMDLTVIDADEIVIAEVPDGAAASIDFADQLNDIGDFDFELTPL